MRPFRQIPVVSAGLLIATAALSGCSVNPIVQWKPVADPPANMDAALADAQVLRQQFEKRRSEFIDRKLATNDVLFGLGVASFAAVVSKLHPDVLKTTTGLMGSTYLYTTTGQQQSVMDAYEVGIGRVNCASAIGRSLRVDAKIVEEQTRQAKDLETALPKLFMAISKAELLLLAVADVDADFKKSANDQIASARTSYTTGSAAYKDAEALGDSAKKSAGKLNETLLAIYQAVNEMASKGVAESKAVLESLKSLAGIAGDIGNSVGAATPAAPGAAGGAESVSGKGGVPPTLTKSRLNADLTAVTDALVAMAAAQGEVAVRADALSGRAARHLHSLESEDWGKCVPDSKVSSLRLSDATVTFTTNRDSDQSRTFTVFGGVTNYTARFVSQPTFGISLVQPPAGGREFTVIVPKTVDAAHDLTVVVEDSSAAHTQVNLAVKVIAGSAPPSGVNEGEVGKGRALSDALRAARSNRAAFGLGSGQGAVKLVVAKVDEDRTGIQVSLACTLGAKPEKYTRAAAKTALLTLLRNSFNLAPTAADAARQSTSLMLADDAGCLK